MGALTDIGKIKELLARHGFRFSKALGQNFLINPSVCPRMAQECGAAPDTGVLEIGPGIGVLTRELAQRAGKVVAVEIDERLLPILSETLAEFENIKIVHGDVMKIDLPRLLREEFGELPVNVCANLPYYITSPIIMLLLEQRLPVESITVMIQLEAAKRFCAPVGSRQAGAVSVAAQYYSEPEILFGVSRGSFLPAPEVDSAVVRFRIRKQPPIRVDEQQFFKMVRGAFSQRRKTVLNSISSAMGCPKPQIAAALLRAGVPENARIEQLSMQQLEAVSNALEG